MIDGAEQVFELAAESEQAEMLAAFVCKHGREQTCDMLLGLAFLVLNGAFDSETMH